MPAANAVVVFTGLPGTGKSTLADRVAVAMGAPSFAGDWLLGALAPHGVLRGLDRKTYLRLYTDLLTTLITRQLLLGQSAVLDCLVDDETVDRWRTLTTEHQARLVVVECRCGDVTVHRRRIEGRVRGIPGWHEVDWAHVERMRAEFVPLTDAGVTVVDTVGVTVDEAVARVLDRIRAA
ncbi:AAA family ATPase [Jiangella mangrovi]|uniref:Putative kinase n=1 Tax=Jiangella mangrovi TaxID=1524084 RepID=A0A7W9LP42_9ACTN|nr:putative kinase [Jiangella mangrovi]